MKQEKKNYHTIAVILSLVLSIVIGMTLHNRQNIADIFKPLGQIYINMIKMVMIPLVMSSLILGIAGITDIRKIGKMGGLTILFFLCTTAMAVIIGLVLSNLFKPGKGTITDNVVYEATQMPSLADTIVNIFPDNIVKSMSDATMLQIIFIAVVLGIALVKIAPEAGDSLRALMNDIFSLFVLITKWIMYLTPLGILGLIVPTVASYGIEVLLPLGKVILVFYLAVCMHIGIVYIISLKTLSHFKIKDFFTAMMPAQIIAFTSCSSAAALPVSMHRVQQELGISKEVSGFVLPLGATINMDGNALYQGVICLFIAQAYGIDLSLQMQIIIVLTGTVASIGAAGVPGAGMIVLSTVLASAGLPIEGVALVAGIDRILDMGRTLTNITGDAVTACIVEEKNNSRDRDNE